MHIKTNMVYYVDYIWDSNDVNPNTIIDLSELNDYIGTDFDRPAFKEMLEVDCCPRAFKPSPKKFVAIIDGYKYALDEVAIIGDQLLTDILGGNRVGITTILINPISKKDHIVTWYNRLREKGIIKKLSKKDIFYRGKYYD